jgi:hypothetical protein
VSYFKKKYTWQSKFKTFARTWTCKVYACTHNFLNLRNHRFCFVYWTNEIRRFVSRAYRAPWKSKIYAFASFAISIQFWSDHYAICYFSNSFYIWSRFFVSNWNVIYFRFVPAIISITQSRVTVSRGHRDTFWREGSRWKDMGYEWEIIWKLLYNFLSQGSLSHSYHAHVTSNLNRYEWEIQSIFCIWSRFFVWKKKPIKGNSRR